MNVEEEISTPMHQWNNMKQKLKVYSSQFNYQYGTSIHFPYSVASLVSYIRTIPDLKDNLDFQKTFIFRNTSPRQI